MLRSYIVSNLPARIKNLLHRKKLILAIVLFVLMLSGFIFIRARNSEPQVSTFVEKGTLKEELILSGKINAKEYSNLFFPVSGKINWIGVKEDDTVKKGQYLASLDQSSVLKSLQSSLLDYSKQRNTFEQTREDEGGSNPQNAPNSEVRRILENNQYDLDKAVIAVELKDIAKRDSVLTSPFEGRIVGKANYFVGNNITFSTSLFQILNPATIYFSVSADQTEVPLLKVGDRCVIMLDSFENKKFEGEIKNISFIPDEEESGTVYKVEVSIRGDIDNLRIGMSGDATFVTDEIDEALYLPSKFIKSDENGEYVLLGNKKEKRYVKIGLETDEDTQVKSGLNEGDLVYD